MKRIWLVSTLIIFSLVACNANRKAVSNVAGLQTGEQVSPSKTQRPTLTSMSTPTDTLTPTITNIPTLTPPPSRTPTQTALPFANAANISIDDQRSLMNLVIDSGKWEQLGLPEQIASRWQAFAGGKTQLTVNETHLMTEFLSQWGVLARLVDKSQLKNKAQFQFRTSITPDAQNGDQIAVYLIDETSGTTRYILIVRDSDENPVGLLVAPEIEGLEERISPDGAYVEYYELKGRTLLAADGRKLNIDDPKEKELRDRLEDLYPNNSYFAYASYPRYFLPGNEIQASFYGLEISLSAMQILQLNEAIALFNRPDLMVLKSALLGPPVTVIVINDIGRAVGLTYSGTGVVEIDRKDLFDNKYWIAMVLAHEASHVLQGEMETKAVPCSEIEKREIGNHKIPDGFYSWTADELVQAVKDLRIGAYHVSLWMLNKLGIKNLKPFQDAIFTGKVNGQSVVIGCKFSGIR